MGRVSRFALLVSKFRGCLVGSLAGDCFGRRMTAAAVDARLRTAADADDLSVSALAGTSLQAGVSTSILRSVGESLIRVRDFDRDDLSSSLRRLDDDDDDQGMRISSRSADADAVVCAAPIVMYFYGDFSRGVQVTGESAGLVQRWISRTAPNSPASSQSEVTSAAVLHCLALQLAFQCDPIRPLNVELFLDRLVSDMAEHEATAERHSNRHATATGPPVIVNQDKPSLRRLEIVRDMLRPTNQCEEAVKALDGDLVSTAIYAFLQVQQRQRFDGAENVTAIEWLLRRQTLPLTLPLPLLACGLTGAFLGIESVPHSVRQLCDGFQNTVKLADNLALQFETQPSVYDRPEISLSQRL